MLSASERPWSVIGRILCRLGWHRPPYVSHADNKRRCPRCGRERPPPKPPIKFDPSNGFSDKWDK